MTYHAQTLANLTRPKLLIRAARSGVQEYRRAKDLKGIAGVSQSASGVYLLDQLFAAEALLEEARHENDASYSIRKHVRVLAALMVEVSLLPALAMAA